MAGFSSDLGRAGLLQLLGGDPGLKARLAAGERLRIETPFKYPGRQGALIVSIGPRPKLEAEAAPEPEPTAGSEPVLESDAAEAVWPPPAPLPEDAVRITDSGGLVKYLAEQGMELEIDMILSRTVFHAVRQWEHTGITGGQIYMDSTAESVTEDLWSFLQLVAEIVGLRHSKYKDALIQLERRREADSGVTGWRPT